MDGNAADYRPRVPPFPRGACVCGAFIYFLATASLVVYPYGLSGAFKALGAVILLGFVAISGAFKALGAVILLGFVALPLIIVSCLAIHGIYEFASFLQRLWIAAADAGGWLADVDDDGKTDADEIIAALPAPFTFTMDVGAAEGWTDCSICLCVAGEGELVRCLPCGHLFHAGCIDGWLRNHTTCPICRANVCTELLPV